MLIDVGLDRHPHADPAAELLTVLERGPRSAFVAWHSLSNFYYLVAPTKGSSDTRDFLVELTTFASVAPTDSESLRYAASLPLPDFEDAMQVAAARACGATMIATRNVRDYRDSPIPARTPAEVLEALGR